MIFLEKIKVNENISSSSIFGLTCQNKINYRKKIELEELLIYFDEKFTYYYVHALFRNTKGVYT